MLQGKSVDLIEAAQEARMVINITRAERSSLFQALGLWGKSEKAGERGKDERGRRRAKEREPVRISLTALCRYSRSCYTL